MRRFDDGSWPAGPPLPPPANLGWANALPQPISPEQVTGRGIPHPLVAQLKQEERKHVAAELNLLQRTEISEARAEGFRRRVDELTTRVDELVRERDEYKKLHGLAEAAMRSANAEAGRLRDQLELAKVEVLRAAGRSATAEAPTAARGGLGVHLRERRQRGVIIRCQGEED